MNVFQIKLKVFIIQDISVEDSQSTLSSFIDSGFIKNQKILEFHESNRF
jgi:CRISPR-associated endoribonuclease Cas6